MPQCSEGSGDYAILHTAPFEGSAGVSVVTSWCKHTPVTLEKQDMRTSGEISVSISRWGLLEGSELGG